MNNFHLQILPLSAAEQSKANDLNGAATIHFFSPLNILSLAILPQILLILVHIPKPPKSSQIFTTIKNHRYQIPWHPVWRMLNVIISPLHRYVSSRFMLQQFPELSHSFIYQERLKLSCQHSQVHTSTTKRTVWFVFTEQLPGASLTGACCDEYSAPSWRIYLFIYLCIRNM